MDNTVNSGNFFMIFLLSVDLLQNYFIWKILSGIHQIAYWNFEINLSIIKESNSLDPDQIMNIYLKTVALQMDHTVTISYVNKIVHLLVDYIEIGLGWLRAL